MIWNLAFLWMSEAVNVWTRLVCVSYQCWFIFVSRRWMGVGSKDAIHITWLMNSSKQRWTLTCCRCRWGNQILQFCHRTSVSIVIKLPCILYRYMYIFYCSSNFPIVAIFIYFTSNLSFIYSYSSKPLTHLKSSGWDQMALVHWFIACYFAICKPKAIGLRLTTHVGL